MWERKGRRGGIDVERGDERWVRRGKMERRSKVGMEREN